MKHLFSILIIIYLFAVSCKKEHDPFLISKHSIGLLTDSTQVKDLELVFSNDSVNKLKNNDAFLKRNNNIKIFDNNGNQLLVLTSENASDSTAVINSVRIIDSRYKTEKNISTLSTFKDINDSYKISKISNLINSIVISVNEINASFTIDKKELPANLRFGANTNIEAAQIPDATPIKYFIIHW